MNPYKPHPLASLKLTARQMEAIEAFIVHGNDKDAGDAIGIGKRALNRRMKSARENAKCKHNIELVLRFRAAQTELVSYEKPAPRPHVRCKPTPPVRSTEPAWPLPPNSVLSLAQQ